MMGKSDFEKNGYRNNWSIYFSEKYNQWMIEHDDGYYIFCDDKEEAYRLADEFTRPVFDC